jgi:hypothetical protein
VESTICARIFWRIQSVRTACDVLAWQLRMV